ncbi:MAG: dihydrolipoyllysine-residue acetyltransferase [Rhodocyclaceae bacterium]
MNEIREIHVPDIGDFNDVPVIEVLVGPGDPVEVNDPVLILESDKATMDVPSPAAGVVASVSVSVGDRVSTGSVILTLQAPPGETPAAQAAATASTTAATAVAVATEPVAEARVAAAVPPAAVSVSAPTSPALAAETSGVKPHASPSVRAYARELGVNLAKVTASGKCGRILHVDVQRFVKHTMLGLDTDPRAGGNVAGAFGGLTLLPWPKVDFARFGEIEVRPLSRIKKISGQNLARNWVMIPHVTNFDEADITDLEAFRARLNQESGQGGAKLTMLAFLIKAAAATLKQFPEFNSSLGGDGDEPALILKRYCHIGFAADTPHGLVVPVVRDADRKGIRDIAEECSELARKARDGKLGPADMTGGTFTVSSLGGIGGTGFTPIINAPEVAILGATRAQIKPVWDGHAFVPRLILPLSLSWDHRVVDGAASARFLVHLTGLLADFRRALL